MKTKKAKLTVHELRAAADALLKAHNNILDLLPWDNTTPQATAIEVNVTQLFGAPLRILEKYTERAEDQR